MMIYIQDVRDAGLCVSGLRRRMTELGVDFRSFMQEGMPVEEWVKIPDPRSKLVAEVKRGKKQ